MHYQQLRVLDEQLAMLEQILGPLAEWGKTWAQFEGLVMTRAVTRRLRAKLRYTGAVEASGSARDRAPYRVPFR